MEATAVGALLVDLSTDSRPGAADGTAVVLLGVIMVSSLIVADAVHVFTVVVQRGAATTPTHDSRPTSQ